MSSEVGRPAVEPFCQLGLSEPECTLDTGVSSRIGGKGIQRHVQGTGDGHDGGKPWIGAITLLHIPKSPYGDASLAGQLGLGEAFGLSDLADTVPER